MLQVAPLTWDDLEGRERLAALGSFELIVGSDVTYRPECLSHSGPKWHDFPYFPWFFHVFHGFLLGFP